MRYFSIPKFYFIHYEKRRCKLKIQICLAKKHDTKVSVTVFIDMHIISLIFYVMDIIVSLAGVWESLGHLLFTFWALVLGGGCCVEKHGKGTHANECEIYA